MSNNLEDLEGIGPKTSKLLNKLGIFRIILRNIMLSREVI